MAAAARRGWQVGDRVRSVPERAWVWFGEWRDRLAVDRNGTVVEVSLAAAETGEGTIRVEWDTLTGGAADPAAWRLWVHSSLVRRDNRGA